MIILLLFASLEGANRLFVRQALVQSAYETVKAAAKSNGTLAKAESIGAQVLEARNLPGHTITLQPRNVDRLSPGTPIVAIVQVAGDSRSVIGFGPFRGLTIEAQATMIKE